MRAKEKQAFEAMLTRCCGILTAEARKRTFRSSAEFERRVREVIHAISDYEVDFHSPAQAFPDIALGEFGVEVKFTTSDSWRSIANSVLETQRVESVRLVYLIYGKMGGMPEVRWADYEDAVVHVRTSHVPRFEVEIPSERNPHESLFRQMGISYDDFRQLNMQGKMRYIRAYARKIHPDGRLWWIEDDGGEEHTAPLQARLYTSLPDAEKKRYRAEAALLCPSIVKSGRSKHKYDDAVLFLLTYHGVVCHQARDLFTAGSVANPRNDDAGGVYIERALKILEPEIREAAQGLPDSLFVEYWGESCPPGERIERWLEKADALATDWQPSHSLFLECDNEENQNSS